MSTEYLLPYRPRTTTGPFSMVVASGAPHFASTVDASSPGSISASPQRRASARAGAVGKSPTRASANAIFRFMTDSSGHILLSAREIFLQLFSAVHRKSCAAHFALQDR